jgi:hypothetical protein
LHEENGCAIFNLNPPLPETAGEGVFYPYAIKKNFRPERKKGVNAGHGAHALFAII